VVTEETKGIAAQHRKWMKEHYGEDWGKQFPAPPQSSGFLWSAWEWIKSVWIFIEIPLWFLFPPLGFRSTLWYGIGYDHARKEPWAIGLRDFFRPNATEYLEVALGHRRSSDRTDHRR
jgi:hypothetical protein